MSPDELVAAADELDGLSLAPFAEGVRDNARDALYEAAKTAKVQAGWLEGVEHAVSNLRDGLEAFERCPWCEAHTPTEAETLAHDPDGCDLAILLEWFAE